MKLLHVLLSARPEGTPRLVLDWLKVEEYDQELLFLFADGEIKSEFEQAGVWQHYNTAFIPSIKNAFKIVQLVQMICEARKPDVVIAWPLGFSHWIAMGASRAGVTKNIAHAGNPANEDFVGKYIHSWVSLGIGNFYNNLVIACSNYVRESFIKIPFISERQFATVYNCINIARFIQPLPANIIRNNDFIMVATLEKHKDHDTLLRAWALFSDSHNSSRLFIVGNGSLKDELTELADRLRLQNVFFLGSRNDVPDLLWKCNFFILSTTVREGFGTVLIEAMAAGCQVIASDVPACREVLQDGKFGTLVKARDALALKNAMLKVIREPTNSSLAERLNYAASFSARQMVDNYIDKLNNR